MVEAQVREAMATFPDLKGIIASYGQPPLRAFPYVLSDSYASPRFAVFNDGSEHELLALTGTIPMVHRGQTLNYLDAESKASFLLTQAPTSQEAHTTFPSASGCCSITPPLHPYSTSSLPAAWRLGL